MKRTKLLIRILVCLIAVIFLVTACGQGTSTSTETPSTSELLDLEKRHLTLNL